METSVRAAVMSEVGVPLVLREVALASPRTGEVRLEIAASGICRSDLSNWTGVLRTPLPVVLGHEAAGTVIELGEGVDSLEIGDRVVVALSPSCGDCLFCTEGRENLCLQMVPGMMGGTLLDGSTRIRDGDTPVYQLCGVGSFAEQAVVAAALCVPIRKELSLDRACLLGCGVITGAGAALNHPEVCEGSAVAVIGCGGVGLAALQGARISGAEKIIAIDIDPAKLVLAEELGATHVVDGRGDVRKQVRKLTGLGADVAIEAIGTPETVATAWEILRPAGLGLVIGMPQAGAKIPIRAGGFFQARRLQGCVYGDGSPHRDIRRLIDLAVSGELLLDPLVSDEISLADVQDALDTLNRGEGARHVILHSR